MENTCFKLQRYDFFYFSTKKTVFAHFFCSDSKKTVPVKKEYIYQYTTCLPFLFLYPVSDRISVFKDKKMTLRCFTLKLKTFNAIYTYKQKI